MTTLEQGATYNHRDFKPLGHGIHGAKGLDPAILTIYDTLVFDNGTTMPAFASWKYGRNLPVHGPFRQLSKAQEAYMTSRPMARVTNVRPDGIAQIADPTNVCIGYAPRYIELAPNGRMLVNR